MFQSSPLPRAVRYARSWYLFLLCVALLLAMPSRGQSPKTITILMLDGKTGKPVVPNNLLVRLDHLDTIHNEALQLNSDGSGKVIVPASASFFSVQGTYHNSLEIYINCDAGREKDTTTLHWYSVADIVNSGVITPDECYKGKYTDDFGITPKPGEFIFFVREIGWLDTHAN